MTLSTTTAWNALITGPKRTNAFFMINIAHLCYDLYQGVGGWLCGLASALELAPWGAVHPANFHMAGPWCQGQSTALRPTDAHFTASEKSGLNHFVRVGDGKGSHSFDVGADCAAPHEGLTRAKSRLLKAQASRL
jgi:hypothetical protein